MKYRKKPVVIEAVMWDGSASTLTEILALVDFENLPSDGVHVTPGIGHSADGTLDIPTLEGTMIAQRGDWIIQGVKGEVYPCKPDIFEATYEAV